MYRMAETYQEQQQQQQNESGMNECEEFEYHHVKVCMYCGKQQGNGACCGEMHFDTQFEIDKNEQSWHERNRKVLNQFDGLITRS